MKKLLKLERLEIDVNSNNAAQFSIHWKRIFLVKLCRSKNIVASRTTAYNPEGNGQCERYNGTIWKTKKLAVRSGNLNIIQWQDVSLDSLHFIRSFLCTATSCTLHKRMFNHLWRSTNGTSIPTWLSVPGPVSYKKHVRSNKYDLLVAELELLEANSDYTYVRLSNRNETTKMLIKAVAENYSLYNKDR